MVHKYQNAVLSIIAGLLGVMAIALVGPSFEAKYFPVYSNFVLVSAEPADDGGTIAVFRYEKFRQCQPRGFAWYLGEFGLTSRQISVEVENRTAPQPLGVHLSKPYKIEVTPEQLRSQVHAVIFTRCHWLWTTKAEIYP